MERKTWITRGILAGAGLLVVAAAVYAAGGMKGGWSRAVRPSEASSGAVAVEVAAPARRPRVEVAFALDTTGSMSGLIDGAKAKIWGIASQIAAGQPTPELRVGLIAYRDRGDEYVTRVADLSGDLDQVFERLSAFQAAGGGDGPEHVNKAFHDAVHSMSWTPDAMKIVFLVGDAPPHIDYQDGYDYQVIAREAAARNIVVHAIRCGGDPETERVWKAIASASGGSFSSIDQSGGVLAISSPYDDRLAELNRRLLGTAVVYGDGEAHGRYARKAGIASAAPAAVAADRGTYFAKSRSKMDSSDILDDLATGTVALGGLEEDKLPAEMKPMDEGARKDYVEKKQAERAAILKEIEAASAERDAYVKSEAKKRGASGFDAVVESSVKEQAQKYGIAYE